MTVARNTKIVATYGPALANDERLRAALRAGANVFRLNMSHADHAAHAAAIRAIREASAGAGMPTAILLDLRGPKIRVGALGVGAIRLAAGETVTLEPGADPGDPGAAAPAVRLAPPAPGHIPIDGYPALGRDVRAGEPVLLDDGELRLIVREATPAGVRCEVVVGGELRAHKGVNLPETQLASLECPTPRDWDDLAFALAQGVDWIALSFVRQAQDIARLRARIEAAGADTPIIAKIEKREALRDLEAIVAAADGVMVARGDLGVETELAEVTLRQKEIIRACNRAGKVVITATQMLESMIHHPTPTRAEVADVSNAIFDGTDALMLSGETAVGEYPIEAIAFMASIAGHTETALDAGRALAARPFLDEVPDAVAHAACVTAHEIGAAALVCLTRSGLTARLVSRYRPGCPIIAMCATPATARRLAPVWGVAALEMAPQLPDEERVAAALAGVRHAGLVPAGGKVVLTAGVGSSSLSRRTNLVRVEVM
jgi:pyruvate kinase